MAFNLRSLATNAGNFLSRVWNGKDPQNQQQGLKNMISNGAQQVGMMANSAYQSSKPVVQGAIKSMASTVANTVQQKAPIVKQNLGSTFTLGKENLRGVVQNYIRNQNVRLDPRANKQIQLDREKYGVPNTGKLVVKSNTNKPQIVQSTSISVTPTKAPPNNIGIGTTIAGFLRQPSGSQFYDSIVKTSNDKKVNPALIAAGLFQESGIDPKAPDNHNYDKYGKIISTDRGIGQINDVAHPEITEAQARDPNFVINWKVNQMVEALKTFPNDINRAVASYNLGIEGAKNSSGPYASGLGKFGQQYINRLAKNLTPEMVAQLGLKVSSPEEEKLIDRLIEEAKKGKKK